MNDSNDMLRSLSADGPLPEHAEKMMLFGQFVGSWDLDMTSYTADGSTEAFLGEWHFGWVLECRAVQDVLVARPKAAVGKASVPRGGVGSTLRVYDPAMDAWWTVWAGPLDREFHTLLGREAGDRIVLEGQRSLSDDDRRFEWNFFDIRDRSFAWEGRVSDDGGHSWRPVEEIHARRR